MTNSDHLSLLRTIFQEGKIVDLPRGQEPFEWSTSQGFAKCNVDMSNRVLSGFTDAGMIAIGRLARALRRSSPTYQRGSTAESFSKEVTSHLLRRLRARDANASAQDDLMDLDHALQKWFAESTTRRRWLVPCAILPYPTRSFDIGPVTFIQRPNVNHAALGIDDTRDITLALDPIDKLLEARSAHWVALVEVDGAEDARSLELANGAVDIALAGLVAILGGDMFRNVGRITGRTMPPHDISVSIGPGGNISTGHRNTMAGLAISPELFEEALRRASAHLVSIGNRTSSYLHLHASMPGLQQSWCDAAFWYHDALVEPLNTVAVAKLETSLECVFAAGNATGSSQRLRQTLKTVFGLEPEQALYKNASITVNDFTNDLVTARSRILHGTWSTLAHELPLSPDEVAPICRAILVWFTTKLDDYCSDANRADDISSFLAWTEAERHVRPRR